jgi:dihydropteroate synthase-like protein
MVEERCTQRIALITGRAASHIVKELVAKEKCVEVIVVPVNVISLIDVSLLKKILLSREDLRRKVEKSDIIVVPGLLKGDTSELSQVLKKPVYKGTRSVTGIPYILKYLREGGKLDTVIPADEILSKVMPSMPFEEAFKIRGLSIALRGPPIRILCELPPQIEEKIIPDLAKNVVKEGADLILIGSYSEWSINKIKKRANIVKKIIGEDLPLGVEIPSLDVFKKINEINIDFIYLPALLLEELKSENYFPEVNNEVAIILADKNLKVIDRALNFLTSLGIKKILIDPVLELPFLGFVDSVLRYKNSQKIEKPLVFSAANVVEEIEADTHGLHALLAAMATELRTSIYSIVMDSYKSLHEVSEAKEALRLSEIAWYKEGTQRGLYSRLLILKQRTPPPPPRLPPGEKIIKSEPIIDKAGYFIIDVDHKRKVIIVEFKGKDSFRLESKSGLLLAREAARRANILREHAAYLGYELHKAELALLLGKTYSQDEPLLEVPWENEDN